MENSVLRAVAAAIRFEREACVAVVKAAQEAGRGLFDVYNEINARGDYWQVPDHHLKAPDGR